MLRQLFMVCLQGLEQEALALLDLHGNGLLEQPWEGPDNLVVLNPNPKKIHKVVYPQDRALHAAALGGNAGLVKEFLKRGADIHARGGNQCDPLMCAAYLGQLEVAKVLLNHGADLCAQDVYYWTALHYAAISNFPKMCEFLISRGADLMEMNMDEQTPNDLYGKSNWFLKKAFIESCQTRLLRAFQCGPHPSQILRRKNEAWVRRWPFVQVLVFHGFQPLQSRRESALPPDAVVPRDQGDYKMLLRHYVLKHPDLWRLIVAFL
jgi:hypothetical protein